jgi:hypothetical protein
MTLLQLAHLSSKSYATHRPGRQLFVHPPFILVLYVFPFHHFFIVHCHISSSSIRRTGSRSIALASVSSHSTIVPGDDAIMPAG